MKVAYLRACLSKCKGQPIHDFFNLFPKASLSDYFSPAELVPLFWDYPTVVAQYTDPTHIPQKTLQLWFKHLVKILATPQIDKLSPYIEGGIEDVVYKGLTSTILFQHQRDFRLVNPHITSSFFVHFLGLVNAQDELRYYVSENKRSLVIDLIEKNDINLCEIHPETGNLSLTMLLNIFERGPNYWYWDNLAKILVNHHHQWQKGERKVSPLQIICRNGLPLIQALQASFLGDFQMHGLMLRLEKVDPELWEELSLPLFRKVFKPNESAESFQEGSKIWLRKLIQFVQQGVDDGRVKKHLQTAPYGECLHTLNKRFFSTLQDGCNNFCTYYGASLKNWKRMHPGQDNTLFVSSKNFKTREKNRRTIFNLKELYPSSEAELITAMKETECDFNSGDLSNHFCDDEFVPLIQKLIDQNSPFLDFPKLFEISLYYENYSMAQMLLKTKPSLKILFMNSENWIQTWRSKFFYDSDHAYQGFKAAWPDFFKIQTPYGSVFSIVFNNMGIVSYNPLRNDAVLSFLKDNHDQLSDMNPETNRPYIFELLKSAAHVCYDTYPKVLELIKDRVDLLKTRCADGYTLEDMIINESPYPSEYERIDDFKRQKKEVLEFVRKYS